MNLRVVMISFIFTAPVYAALTELPLTGRWVEEGVLNRQQIPIHMFSLDIKIANDALSGHACYIANYGQRIDCDNPFYGKKISPNTYIVNFNSQFGGRDGLAELHVTDHQQLLWTLLKAPKQGEYYAPTHAVLHLDQSSKHYLTINKTKVFIYKDPEAQSPSQSYLVLGDKVIAKRKQGNAWLQIQYKDQVLGWIKATDVD